MENIRKRYTAQEKAKIVLEVLKGELTQSQFTTAKYGVHNTQLHTWKKQAIEAIIAWFSDKRKHGLRGQNELIEELYKQIGQLKVELDWLKKNLNCFDKNVSGLIDFNGKLSIRRQCELLGINRSSLYYKPAKVGPETLLLTRLVDEEYTRHPFYGTRRMCAYLRNLGYAINRKRVGRLYNLLGLEALYPKPNLSKVQAKAARFPYLLRDMVIDRRDQVWSADITYIRLKCGFVYLMAIIDWFSRYVLDWELSISLEADFCIETLARALSSGKCEIFNTDQGPQFTSDGFIGLLLSNGIKISMDSIGRDQGVGFS